MFYFKMTEVDNLNIFGERTKFIWELFKQYKNNNHNVIQQKSIRRALNNIHLYPTHSQIHELVHRACEINGRTPVDHLTFGEFAFLISELQQHYLNNSPAMTPRSQLKSKAVQILEERRIRRRFSHSSGFQVFLGGSCNPTTWRTDVAIPFLKKCGITYYNPQVCNWKPELMELEDQAKQTAELLLFVIDNQTRSTASMVEAAYIAGCGRQLVLVIKRFQAPVFIYDEELKQSELEDLERSHAYLTDLVERMSIPVFTDLKVALNCARKAVLQQVKVSDLTVEDGSQPIKHPHVRIANELLNVKEVFNNVDTHCNGKLSFEDANFAFKSMTSYDLPSDLSSREYFTFENFCCLLSEFKYSKRKGFFQLLFSLFFYVPYRILDWLGWWNPTRKADVELRKRDVFLGGSCGSSKWRDEIAIPILRKHGVSYYNPQLDGWNTHCIPREAAIKDSCQVLLYVITEDTRAMTSLLEAGYFIGQGCNVVLCIKNMKHGVVIDNEQLTESAVADYNRSRSYLADLANRDGVPVLDDISEAVNCAVARFKECRDSECLFS